MAIKWTNKSAINREIEMAERHTDRVRNGIGLSNNYEATPISRLSFYSCIFTAGSGLASAPQDYTRVRTIEPELFFI